MKIRAQLHYPDGPHQVILDEQQYPHPEFLITRLHGGVLLFKKIETLKFAHTFFHGEPIDLVAYEQVDVDRVVEIPLRPAEWKDREAA